MKACSACRMIVNEASECPNCHSTSLTEKYMGTLALMDPEKSLIGARLEAKAPGRYAIKIQQK